MPHLLCSHRIVGMAVDGGYRWQTKQYGTSCVQLRSHLASLLRCFSSSEGFKGLWQSSKKAKNPMSKMIAKCTLSISEQSVWALASGCKCLVVLLLLGIVGLIWRPNFFFLSPSHSTQSNWAFGRIALRKNAGNFDWRQKPNNVMMAFLSCQIQRGCPVASRRLILVGPGFNQHLQS